MTTIQRRLAPELNLRSLRYKSDLGAQIMRSHAIVQAAIAEYKPVAVLGLFSGGNDSTTFMHLMRRYIDHAVHVNTGIGIEATREFVRQTCAGWGLPLIEQHPPDSYEDLVMGRVLASKGPNAGKPVWEGFPGPKGHQMMYTRLKERALRQVRAQFITDSRNQRVIYLAGMRFDESKRRARNANEVDREGSVVWVSPIVHWSSEHMRLYRKRHPEIPRNPVSAFLHMSGECLCGAFARPGELDEIALWFPETAERIRSLEQEAESAGVKRCKWGQKPPAQERGTGGRLCTTCVSTQEPDLEEWAANPALMRV